MYNFFNFYTVPLILFVLKSGINSISMLTDNLRFLDCDRLFLFFLLIFVYVTKLKRAIMWDNLAKLWLNYFVT